MKILDINDIIKMHTTLIKETGGINGIRDIGLLESAVYSPFQTFGKEYIYKSIEEKASRLCYSLVNNHAFIDGNKRIGVLTMLVFLELNGIIINCTDNELIKLGLGLANNKISSDMLLTWILNHKK